MSDPTPAQIDALDLNDAFTDEVVDVARTAVKAAVRNIPGHVSDRASDDIARAVLHAFTPRLADLIRQAEADEREARCPAESRGLCAEPYCDGSKKVDEWLEDKYRVTRRDGRDAPGEKHSVCRYFVLDLTHDALARELLAQYQGSQPRDDERTVSAEEVDAARDAADTSMAMDEHEWCVLFLRALDITVEAPRG